MRSLMFLKLSESKGLYLPSLPLENFYGLDSPTPNTAALKCAPTSLNYGIMLIFVARNLKSVSFSFLDTFSN